MINYKNGITFAFLAIMLFTMTACEETSTYNGESLDGVWEVDELLPNDNLPSGYLVSIEHDENNSATIKISNFLDQYGDYEVSDPTYVLIANITGSRISISSQGIGEVIVKLGSGQVNNENNFKIDYTYLLDGRTFSGSANFVRKSK